MKKCANCGFENPDDEINCPACSTDTFVSSSPTAIGGHIISPEEQRFWERMTFRQFAIFIIRLQSLWILFNGLVYATYLPRYLYTRTPWTLLTFFEVFRIALHIAAAFLCIRFADRIVSWFVKDTIPKQPPISQDNNTAA